MRYDWYWIRCSKGVKITWIQKFFIWLSINSNSSKELGCVFNNHFLFRFWQQLHRDFSNRAIYPRTKLLYHRTLPWLPWFVSFCFFPKLECSSPFRTRIVACFGRLFSTIQPRIVFCCVLWLIYRRSSNGGRSSRPRFRNPTSREVWLCAATTGWFT